MHIWGAYVYQVSMSNHVPGGGVPMPMPTQDDDNRQSMIV